jgi:hypothetical protein
MIGEQVNQPAAQHLNEMRLNRSVWEKKALLRGIYRGFYRLIAEQLAPDSGAKTVELGWSSWKKMNRSIAYGK